MNEHSPRHAICVKSSSDRGFGLTFSGVSTLVAVWPVIHGHAPRGWPLLAALAFAFIALIRPQLLAPLNRWWTKFGLLLHRLVSPIVLGILFFTTIMPIGLGMRLFGKDFLRLRLDKHIDTYWIERTPAGPTADSMRNQF